MTDRDDLERFGERMTDLVDMAGITTREQFVKAVKKALDGKLTQKQKMALLKTGAVNVKLRQQKLLESAGGMDLTKDRRKTAKIILTNVDDYRRVGAPRSDLKGFDTRRSYGYSKGRRRLIDPNRTRVVRYPESYTRKDGVVVRIKNRDRLFLFDKKGKRLSAKRR